MLPRSSMPLAKRLWPGLRKPRPRCGCCSIRADPGRFGPKRTSWGQPGERGNVPNAGRTRSLHAGAALSARPTRLLLSWEAALSFGGRQTGRPLIRSRERNSARRVAAQSTARGVKEAAARAPHRLPPFGYSGRTRPGALSPGSTGSQPPPSPPTVAAQLLVSNRDRDALAPRALARSSTGMTGECRLSRS